MGTLFKAAQGSFRKRFAAGENLNDKQLALANFGVAEGEQLRRPSAQLVPEPTAPPPETGGPVAPDAPAEEPMGDATGREVFVQTGAGVGGGVARAAESPARRERFSIGGGGGSGINI